MTRVGKACVKHDCTIRDYLSPQINTSLTLLTLLRAYDYLAALAVKRVWSHP